MTSEKGDRCQSTMDHGSSIFRLFPRLLQPNYHKLSVQLTSTRFGKTIKHILDCDDFILKRTISAQGWRSHRGLLLRWWCSKWRRFSCCHEFCSDFGMSYAIYLQVIASLWDECHEYSSVLSYMMNLKGTMDSQSAPGWRISSGEMALHPELLGKRSPLCIPDTRNFFIYSENLFLDMECTVFVWTGMIYWLVMMQRNKHEHLHSPKESLSLLKQWHTGYIL